MPSTPNISLASLLGAKGRECVHAVQGIDQEISKASKSGMCAVCRGGLALEIWLSDR